MDLSNWFGLVQGSYIGKAPLYVDTARRPGDSKVPVPTLLGWVQRAPWVLLTSPNFVWALIALVLYGVFPYNLTMALESPLSLQFFLERFPLWFAVTMGYTSFWHVALYWFHAAKRPFLENRVYTLDKVAHNMAWTTSGIAIFTAFENVMCYLWSTGRLSYITDSNSFGSLGGIASFLLTLGLVPLWRSVHFYFAHRFLHMDTMYRLV
jgi:hypothetical protein